jgi:K+-transporting ATPase ATPase A chain
MHATDWLQFALFIGLLALITKPLGLYLMQGARCQWPHLARPGHQAVRTNHLQAARHRSGARAGLEAIHLRHAGLQRWWACFFTYAILRLQHLLPWNPQGLPA